MRLMRPSYVASLVLLFAAYGCGDSTSPQPLPSVSIVSGDAQQVPLGQTEPAPLIVAVTAPNGDPMPGVQVNWGIVSGGGSLSATSSMTDQSGHASVTWTLGLSGPQVVKAWADLDRTEPVNFSANPVSVAVTMVSGDAQKGPFAMALPAPLVVSVKTVGGTPLPNVKVNWGVAAGGGSLSSASSLTDQNGNASITWTLGPSPNVGQSVGAWTDIEGSPKITFSATAEKLLVLHYDGNSWTQSLLTQNTGMSLDAGWAASTSKAFAGGTACPNPLSYDSGVWSGMDACNGNSLRVTSIWGTAPSDVWAVGTGHGARISDPSFAWIYHFDGSAWTVSYTDGDASHPPELLAVGTRSTDDVIAVGKNGRIIRHAGQQWNEQTSGTTNDLLAVWGDPHSANVFAVGNAGTIVNYNGAAWQTQTSGTSAPLRGVWGSSGSDVFAVGDNGTILHFDGGSWSAQSSGTTQNLRAVWGSSSNSVFAVGDGGTVLRYNGSAWTPVSTGFQMAFTGVWGTSPTDVFVSGN